MEGKRLRNSEQALKIKSEVLEAKINGSKKGINTKVKKFHKNLKNKFWLN